MTAKKFNERSWWRRLARRARAAEPRANRLSHFEPLEPRMVLSAGIWMDGADLWHGPQHEQDHFNNGHGHGNDTAEYGFAADRQFMVGSPAAFVAHEEIEYQQTAFAPQALDSGSIASPQLHSSVGLQTQLDYGTDEAEGESTLSIPTLSSPTLISSAAPTFIMPTGPIAPPSLAPYSFTVPAYEIHILIVPDEYSHSSVELSSTSPAISARAITIVPSYAASPDVGFASLMAALSRRVENPPPDPGETHHVPGPVSEDLVPGASKSTTSSLAAQESASILAALSSGSAARLINFVHVAANDDDGSTSQRPLAPSAVSESQADDDGESVDPATDAVIAAKRKLGTNSESRPVVQTQLDGLVDLPVVRVTESLFRELLALYDNASQAQSQAAATTGTPDDGMVELLAADVSSLASRRIALPVSGEQHGTTLESNVALYQSLEIAGLEDVASAAVQAQAAPVAAEQLARVE